MKIHSLIVWTIIFDKSQAFLQNHGNPRNFQVITLARDYSFTEEGGPTLIFSRSLEVAKVGIQLFFPLLTSAITHQFHNVQGKNEPKDPWESYWACGDKISNAHRVVQAMEALGPTYVKFGQALASRPDVIPKTLASALTILQDDMMAFDTIIAQNIIRKELNNAGIDDGDIDKLISSLSEEPVAAASVGQVYKGFIDGFGPVAVKVQRPGIRALVEKDAVLLKSIAILIESIPAFPTTESDVESRRRLINTEIVSAVDEFMSRIFEELDYRNEADNARKFAKLYAKEYGVARFSLPGGGVIVPKIMTEYCTENIIVMEWIEGTKLANLKEISVDAEDDKLTNLALIEQALYVTMSQLLDHGLMHADPHGGNLLRVSISGQQYLAYLDFGLLSTIPLNVRDGLVCAVAQLIFAKDVQAVACLFGELNLLPAEILNDVQERHALTEALEKTLEETLVYPLGEDLKGLQSISSNSRSTVPTLKFDKLLDGLVRLVPRFKFQLPPYFINNARALSTLEGIARSLDPTANAFTIMYPYALNRILENPSQSPIVDATIQSMVRDKYTGKIDRQKLARLLRDSAMYSGSRKRKILRDVLKTRTGRNLTREAILGVFSEWIRFRWIRKQFSTVLTKGGSILRLDYLRL